MIQSHNARCRGATNKFVNVSKNQNFIRFRMTYDVHTKHDPTQIGAFLIFLVAAKLVPSIDRQQFVRIPKQLRCGTVEQQYVQRLTTTHHHPVFYCTGVFEQFCLFVVIIVVAVVVQENDNFYGPYRRYHHCSNCRYETVVNNAVRWRPCVFGGRIDMV
jgi:hypothetical protein